MSDDVLEELVKRAEEVLPTEAERPFYECFIGIRDLSYLGRRDFRVVSRFYGSYRSGIQKSLDLVKGRARELVDRPARSEVVKVIREAMKHRLIARLRATGLVVLADALVDNLLVRLFGERPKSGFGPRIQERAFTEVLQAGANASRHGHEWFNRLIAGFESGLPGANVDDLRAYMEEHLEPRQGKSLGAIVEVTGLEPFGAYDAPAATLLELGEHEFKVFANRFTAAMIHIANHANKRADLDAAFLRLGVPVRVVEVWEALLT